MRDEQRELITKKSDRVAQQEEVKEEPDVIDLEEAHVLLVKQIHAVRRIPRMLEAKNSLERETMLDKVSSDEEFFREHLNRSFPVAEKSLEPPKQNYSRKENPNLVAIATYEQSEKNSLDDIKMRSSISKLSKGRQSNPKCQARLGYHSCRSSSVRALRSSNKLNQTHSLSNYH